MNVMKFFVAAVCVLGVSIAQANIVSWNLDDYGTVGADDGSYSTNVAGVVPAANWQNTWWTDPTTDLADNTGGTTTIDLSYSSYSTYRLTGSEVHPGVDADGTYNREMLQGYLNSGPAGWNPSPISSSVTLSQIVDDGVAGYDLYVYVSSDVAGREFSVTDGTTTYYANSLGAAAINDASGNATFALGADTSTDGYASAANYFVFSGLTDASQTVTAQFRDNDEWGGIAGVQVVGVVPEPVTMGLVGIFGIGLLFIRRRFMV